MYACLSVFLLVFVLQGECIGLGTYQELSKSGLDFMSLEDDDSAFESESEAHPDVNRQRRHLARHVSRQHSQHDGFWGKSRSGSLISCPSHKESLYMESQLSVVTSETEISIYVSEHFKSFRSLL